MLSVYARRMSGRTWRVCPLLIALILLSIMVSVWASAPGVLSQPSEYEIKAAYLFNFARFVKWPPQKLTESDSPFVIGVAGDDPFGATLDSVIRGKKVYDHKLVVRRFSKGDDLRKCHLLFISRMDDARLLAIIGDLHNEAVLTVGESDQFIGRGGMINFTAINETIHFEINPAAAEKAGLKIDSRLLRLAVAANAGRAQIEH